MASRDSLASFHPAVREWFAASFAQPTRAQAKGWPPILEGRSTLLLAPTGSGKTLAAFLAARSTGFALPGADDPLRAERDAPEEARTLALSATDPASPYGAARCGLPHRKAPPSVPSGDSLAMRKSGSDGSRVLLLGYAARGVSQRGGASRRGSESAARDQSRGRAPLGEPRAGGEARSRVSGSDRQVPSKRKRRFRPRHGRRRPASRPCGVEFPR